MNHADTVNGSSGPLSLSEREQSSTHHTDNRRNETVSESIDKNQQLDQHPHGGYGWVCAVAVAVINAHSWGFNSSYAVFLAYYLEHETYKGATNLQYAFVGSLSLATTFLVSPIATIAVSKYGIRNTMLTGVIFETAGLILASLSSRIWQLFLTQGVLFGTGMGMLFVPVAAVVPQWFDKRRSLATGISLSGAGLGGFVYSLVAEALIRDLGVTWTFRIFSILAAIVNTICIILIKSRSSPSRKDKVAMEVYMFIERGFLCLIGFSCFTIFGYFILIFSLAHYGIDIGLTASHASLISGLLNLGQAVGRPLIGYFSDSLGRIRMAGWTTFAAGVICLAVWINAKSFGLLLFFAISEGLVAGNFWATIAPLVAEVTGFSKVPSGMNLVWLSIIIPSTFSEPIALQITSATQSYFGAQVLAGIMYIAAAACLAVLSVQQRKS